MVLIGYMDSLPIYGPKIFYMDSLSLYGLIVDIWTQNSLYGLFVVIWTLCRYMDSLSIYGLKIDVQMKIEYFSHLDYNPNPNIIENIIPLLAFGL